MKESGQDGAPRALDDLEPAVRRATVVFFMELRQRVHTLVQINAFRTK